MLTLEVGPSRGLQPFAAADVPRSRKPKTAVNATAGTAAIAIRFHARDLHLVMAGPPDGARFVLTIDGQPPGEEHGLDVDAQGRGRVNASRLYQLVRQRGAVRDRRLEIRFLDPGVRAYAFTFG